MSSNSCDSTGLPAGTVKLCLWQISQNELRVVLFFIGIIYFLLKGTKIQEKHFFFQSHEKKNKPK